MRRLRPMTRQTLGNAFAGLLFFAIAIVDFARDSSGIGVVFLVFAAVFLGSPRRVRERNGALPAGKNKQVISPPVGRAAPLAAESVRASTGQQTHDSLPNFVQLFLRSRESLTL